MRPGSNLLREALATGQRTYDLQVRLGGRDVTDEVTAWSVDRGSDTGLPAQVAAPTGSSAAGAQLTLAGTGEQTAAARYSPWAPRSTADITRPGQSCVLEWGLAEGRMQALRGRVRTVAATAGSGTAALRVLDGSELLRDRAWLPPGILAGASSHIHTQWVVDHALRMAGITMTPPERAGSIFFASMNGALEANRGMRHWHTGSVGFWPERSAWGAGPAWGSANAYSTWSAQYSPQRRVLSQQNDLMVEWWIHRRTTSDNPTSQVTLVFADRPTTDVAGRQEQTITLSYNPATRALRAQVGGGATTWTVPAGANQSGSFKVAFLVSLTTTTAPTQVRGWLYQPGGTLYASPTYSGAATPWSVLETITCQATGPMECVGVSVVSGVVPVVEPWQRGAHIDLIGPSGVTSGQSRYALRALPEAGGTWWDLLKEIAADNLSYISFDEDGFFRFRRYEYLTPDSPPPEPDLTVTSARDINDLAVTEEIDGVANLVEVGHTEWDIGATQSEQHPYPSVFSIPSNSALSLQVDMSDRLWATRAPMLFAGAGFPSALPGSVVKFLNTAGQRAPVETELTWDTGHPVFTFHNRSASTATAALSPAGTAPSFRIAYTPVQSASPAPVRRHNAASANRFGVQSLSVAASSWVQSIWWADQLALAIIAWTAWPIPLTGRVQILPDPRIQQGDVVHIQDPSGTRIDGLYRVLGYAVSGDGTSVSMSLDVRPLSRPTPPSDAGLTLEPVLDPAVAPTLSG